MKFVLQVVEEKGNPMKLGYGLPGMPDLTKPFIFTNYTEPIKIPAPLYV